MTNIERRIVPRLEVSSEQFRLSANGKVFSVRDLSRTGMGLRLLELEDRYHFTVGRSIEGLLNIDRERFRIQARVVRSVDEQVGLTFESLPKETDEALGRLLDPVEIGTRLKLMPHTGRPQEMIWYHGPFSTDVVVWSTPEARVLVSLMGVFAQCSQSEGLRTGTVLSSDYSDHGSGLVFLESLQLSFDTEVDLIKLNLVRNLLSSSVVSNEIKEQFK